MTIFLLPRVALYSHAASLTCSGSDAAVPSSSFAKPWLTSRWLTSSARTSRRTPQINRRARGGRAAGARLACGLGPHRLLRRFPLGSGRGNARAPTRAKPKPEPARGLALFTAHSLRWPLPQLNKPLPSAGGVDRKRASAGRYWHYPNGARTIGVKRDGSSILRPITAIPVSARGGRCTVFRKIRWASALADRTA